MSSPDKKKWKNPNEVMKIHRIKKGNRSGSSLLRSNSTSAMIQRKVSADNSENMLSCHSRSNSLDSRGEFSNRSVKRRNPFGCEQDPPLKRKSFDEVELLASKDKINPAFQRRRPSDEQSKTLLQILKKQEENESENLKLKEQSEEGSISSQCSLSVPRVRELQNQKDEKEITGSIETAAGKKKKEPLSQYPPVDWSLKSKMRILTDAVMDMWKQYPGIDAKHLHSFVHCLDNGKEWDDLNLYQKVRRCCMHYTYPHLPWIKLFPRLAGDFKSREGTSFAANSDAILKSLQTDWSCAFLSVYQQLRGGLCPYFYLCTHQFTVLFRCKKSEFGTSMSACLSPSTRGLREMIKEEGIAFSMPNLNKEQKNTVKKSGHDKKEEIKENALHAQLEGSLEGSESISEPNERGDLSTLLSNKDEDVIAKGSQNEEENEDETDMSDDDLDDHVAASKWLEGMGLDKKDFPTLEPVKVKLQREGFREIDNRPQSMLYVQGPDVHALFNFLLNYPSCIASSGPQMGIPPTILSPVPFGGGVLVTNSVKHSQVAGNLRTGQGDSATTSSSDITHVIEIAGPILPHHVLNLSCILHRYPSAHQSVMSFSTHFSSAALNTQMVNDPEQDRLTSNLSKLLGENSFSNAGLMEEVKEVVSAAPVLENTTHVKEMTVTASGFSWKT